MVFGRFRSAIQNDFEVVHGWILYEQLAEETIELGFRKGIGAFHFERVLCRHDEEGFR